MIAIDEAKKLTPKNLAPVSLVTGDDLGQYSLLKEAILQSLHFDPSDLSYSYFDLSEHSFQEAERDLESLPFFAEEKIVIFDQFLDITSAKKHFLEDKELRRLEAYLENPVESTKLILFAPGKLDGKRRLVKLLRRDAHIFEAAALKERDLRTHFQKYAHDLGLSFEKGVFDNLLIKSNLDFASMQKNLSFLSAYKKNGLVSQKDLEEAVPKTLQDNVFDLTQLVLTGQMLQAQDLIKDLRLQGEDEVKLLAIMIGQFRTFLQVQILSSQHKSEQEIIGSLSDYLGRKVNPYQIKFAIRDSRTLSIAFLKFCLIQLIDTDYQIKTGRYEKNYLFDLAILKIATYKK